MQACVSSMPSPMFTINKPQRDMKGGGNAAAPTLNYAVTKAVVPIAGKSSRMRPQSLVQPKCLLPFFVKSQYGGSVESSGLNDLAVQPALHLLLDELLTNSPIEQVCLVAAPEHLPQLHSYLSTLTLDGNGLVSRELNPFGSKLELLSNHNHHNHYLGGRVKILFQNSPRGFGDAVMIAREFTGNEPFLVALGDHIFTRNAVSNMIDTYSSLVQSTSSHPIHIDIGLTGACYCTEAEIPTTGLLKLEDCYGSIDHRIFSPVHDMAEKPISYKRFEASTSGRYLSQLGLDILPPSIYTELEQFYPPNDSEEVDLRKAMYNLMKQKKLYGSVVPNATRYDFGNPIAYRNAMEVVLKGLGGDLRAEGVTVSDKSTVQDDKESRLITWLRSVAFPETVSVVLGLHDCSRASPQLYVASSPGRIDVMGGVADYSGSHVLQYPISRRTYAFIVLSDANAAIPRVNMASLQVNSLEEIVRKPNRHHPFKLWEKSYDISVLSAANEVALRAQVALEDETSRQVYVDNESKLWPLYALGALRESAIRADVNNSCLGLTLILLSDLPLNAGLASSAAVEMSVLLAANTAFNNISLNENQMECSLICQAIENKVLGAPSGCMDQLTVAHADENKLLPINCRVPIKRSAVGTGIPIPDKVEISAIQCGITRDVSGLQYSRAHTASVMGKILLSQQSELSKLQNVVDIDPELFTRSLKNVLPLEMTGEEFLERCATLVPKSLTIDPAVKYPVLAAVSFPIEENARVKEFVRLVQLLNNSPMDDELDVRTLLQQVGELMTQSHRGYSSLGLGMFETDLLVDLVKSDSGLISAGSGFGFVGARVTGGGGGGSVAVLSYHGKSMMTGGGGPATREALEHIRSQYTRRTGLPCSIVTGSSGRARSHGSARWYSTTMGTGYDTDTSNGNRKPRVLLVNHGYPPQFNGGSEVYTQTLAVELLKSGNCESVDVFSREHDPFRSDFDVRVTHDKIESELAVHLVNIPREAPYHRFSYEPLNIVFREFIEKINPDIVHIGHLNHLSIDIPEVVKLSTKAKVLYTLHDYWLMCPRGQFLMTGVTARGGEPWRHCSSQSNDKCAVNCFSSRYATGLSTLNSDSAELDYWTDWVGNRMEAVRRSCNHIDAFIAPSKYLQQKFLTDFDIPKEKILYLPYGFDRLRLSGRKKIAHNASDKPYVFGYIGRHQPFKGINLIIEAAARLISSTHCMHSFHVLIFGRADVATNATLRRMIAELGLNDKFEWRNEYSNENIVKEVFNEVDAIIVPSIWEENSPLVIHEAQQCGVPVITSELGGMGELVRKGYNGLTFTHRSSASLANEMMTAINNPTEMSVMGRRGYLGSADGQVPSVNDHVHSMLSQYHSLLNDGIVKSMNHGSIDVSIGSDQQIISKSPEVPKLTQLKAPYRITFDTNPDDCNFKCTMCEQHSEHSPHQIARKANKIRRRRMDFAVVRKAVEQTAPLGLKEIIPTTMGEPLQYKDFPKFIDLCAEFNVKLNLTTNGSFVGRGAHAWAELICPVGSDVKISWNGASEATQESIMKGSKLSTQLQNLKTFIAVRDRIASEPGGNRCSVTLQLTFMEKNLQEIPAIVKLAIEHGCDRVKGHHLWAHFSEIKDEDLRRSKESILRWNEVAKKCHELSDTFLLPNGQKTKLENFSLLDADTFLDIGISDQAVCPFLGKEAWVNNYGRFDPCCAPDEERKSLGDFGLVTDSSIMDIWNSSRYQELVNSYQSKPLCRTCTMRKLPTTTAI